LSHRWDPETIGDAVGTEFDPVTGVAGDAVPSRIDYPATSSRVTLCHTGRIFVLTDRIGKDEPNVR
jgi:hypothetical protein